jgi:hypothetical protein
MSYSLSLHAAKQDLADESSATTEAITAYQPPGPQVDEARNHLRVVAEVVPALVAAVGTDDDHVHISISGHANVDHKPADGWADEFVTVTVGVVHPSAIRPGAQI